jgi:LysR family transcriptional regulator, transcriptional activator of nhaA
VGRPAALLTFNHLHYFHVAAVEGSVAAAAEKLGVTQPTVSEQLRALEKSLGVVLFERTPSGLKLTDAGRLAFEHTSVMFRAGERLVESLGHDAREMPRTLRVGLSTSVARATSSDFLLPLLAMNECVPVIRSTDSVELLRALRASELDLVLCETEPPEAAKRGLEIAVIDKTTLVAVTSPRIAPTADWQDVHLIHYRASSAYRWEVETFLRANKLHPKMAGEADDSLFMVEAAAHGSYVVVVPRLVARDAISNGRLKVLAQFESSQSGVHALYQEGTSAELSRRAVELLITQAKSLTE